GAYWEARDDMQVWLPLSSQRRLFPDYPAGAELFRAVARLQPGISRESATSAVEVVGARIGAALDRGQPQGELPRGRDPSAQVVPHLSGTVDPDFDADARFAKLSFGVLGLLAPLVT